jgi:hypothetical protein
LGFLPTAFMIVGIRTLRHLSVMRSWVGWIRQWSENGPKATNCPKNAHDGQAFE